MYKVYSHIYVFIKNIDLNFIFAESANFMLCTVSGSGTGPLDYGATGPVPDP